MGNDRKIKIALVSCGTDSAYHSAFANFLSEECTKYDYHIIWYQSVFMDEYTGKPHEVGEMNIYNLINYDMIDVIVMLTTTMKHEDSKRMVIEKAKEHNVPLISVDEYVEGAVNIDLDYEGCIEEIIKHVIEVHGAKTLNFIAGMRGNPLSDQREAIFRRLLTEYGLEVDERRIDVGWFWYEGAEQVFERWHNEGLVPDAVICANDSMAIGVCNKAAALGYNVPEDFIVTGLDGIDEAMSYVPQITTGKISIAEVSHEIINVIRRILGGDRSFSDVIKIKAERIYSQSCGCKELTPAADDNKFKHELYDDLNKFKGYTKSIINIADEVVIDADFRVTMDRMLPFFEKMWSQSAWICVCDNFVSDISSLSDLYSTYVDYQREGYSEIIGHCVRYRNDTKKVERVAPFRTADLLPDLDELFSRYHHIMVQPLHFQERTIGYLALEFDFCIGNFSVLNTFDCSVISLVLENARVQSELHGFANMLEEMNVRDPMTKLLNRRGFYKFAPIIYRKCMEEKKPFMIMSVDLDNLKTINDTYGHADGDNAITKMARALDQTVIGDIITARFGGDEYIAAGTCDPSGLGEDYEARIHAFLNEYNSVSGKPYKVDASIGIYKAVPNEGEPIDVFITEADKVMYSVKKFRKSHSRQTQSRGLAVDSEDL